VIYKYNQNYRVERESVKRVIIVKNFLHRD